MTAGRFTDKEAVLQALTEQWMTRLDMPFAAQQQVPGGSVDLMLMLSHEDRTPWCIVELKPGLSVSKSSVKDLANYFEQCVKYHLRTGLPVFLGPFFTPTMRAIEYLSGGSQPRYASASFSAYAGRMNVGLLFVAAPVGYENQPDYWEGFRMSMRQEFVAEWSRLSDHFQRWPTEQIKLVSFGGAASESLRG